MRLNLYLAKSGLCSRRRADKLIKSGAIKINTKTVVEPWFQVEDGDEVSYYKQKIKLPSKFYLALNKPRGVTSTRRDRFAKKTVIGLLPSKFRGLYPVGRLDKNSSGLLLLTNDGQFCYHLTHPKFGVQKVYQIKLKGGLNDTGKQRALQGVIDNGQKLKVDKIKIDKLKPEVTLVEAVVHQGHKRHLRRLFAKIGYPVIELNRVRIGPVKLGSLKPGKYRFLSKSELAKLNWQQKR
jgi:23S rRNA pseudouridine2605 synthase